MCVFTCYEVLMLYSIITYIYTILFLYNFYFIAGCAPYRGGETAQESELDEGGGVHGGRAEFKAVQ